MATVEGILLLLLIIAISSNTMKAKLITAIIATYMRTFPAETIKNQFFGRLIIDISSSQVSLYAFELL
jgi:hypothetical protein